MKIYIYRVQVSGVLTDNPCYLISIKNKIYYRTSMPNKKLTKRYLNYMRPFVDNDFLKYVGKDKIELLGIIYTKVKEYMI